MVGFIVVAFQHHPSPSSHVVSVGLLRNSSYVYFETQGLCSITLYLAMLNAKVSFHRAMYQTLNIRIHYYTWQSIV